MEGNRPRHDFQGILTRRHALEKFTVLYANLKSINFRKMAVLRKKIINCKLKLYSERFYRKKKKKNEGVTCSLAGVADALNLLCRANLCTISCSNPTESEGLMLAVLIGYFLTQFMISPI